MEQLNRIKKFFKDLWDKVSVMELQDFFPLNKKADYYDIKSVLTYTGIYVGALVVCAMIIILLGGIPYIGWLFIGIGGLAAIYGVAGLLVLVFEYMKNN